MNDTVIMQIGLQCDRHIPMFKTTGLATMENPFRKIYPFIVLRVLMLITLSKILGYLLKPLKQTSYVYNLLAGIMLGPSMLGMLVEYQELKDTPNQRQLINFGAYLGLIYYAFITAVQIDGSLIQRASKEARGIGLTSVFIPSIAMLIPIIYLNPIQYTSPVEMLIYSMHVPKTSLVNLAPVLRELNLLTTDLGQLTLPGALMNDVSMWLFFVVLVLVRQIRTNLFKCVVPIISLVLFNIYVLRPAMKHVVKNTPKGEPIKEMYILMVLITMGCMTFLWDWLAGFAIIGTIFFGLIVPNGPPLGSAVVERSEMFIREFLLPFVYLAVGDMVRFSDLRENWRAHVMFQGAITLGYLAKVFAVALNAMFYNISVGKAFSIGLMMNASGIQQSQFYWSVCLRQRITRRVATHLVLSNLCVTMLMVPLSAWLYNRTKNMEDSIGGFELSINEASLGSSKLDVLTCVENEEEVASIIALLKATNHLENSPLSLHMVHVNELVGQVTPSLIEHKKHRRICKHNGCVNISSALDNYVQYSMKRVDVHLLTMIAPLKDMHDGIARLTKEKLIPLIILPVTTYGGQIKKSGNNKAVFSSTLRCKIQEDVPCTVGIFLDMGLMDKKNINYSSQLTIPSWDHHILVIFFGGKDDREVLTYAMRMLGHPSVTITVIKILFEQSNEKYYTTRKNYEEKEKLHDQELIDLYKSKVVENGTQTAYREVQVFELPQVMDIIPSLNIPYDLIITGRHREFDLDEGDMIVLSEYTELGFFGEFLASTKFSWGKVSILILQHCVPSEKDRLNNLLPLDDDFS